MMSKCLLGLGGRLEGKRLVKWDGDRVWKGRTASPKHPTKTVNLFQVLHSIYNIYYGIKCISYT